MMEAVSLCCLLWCDCDLKSQESPSSPHYPGASREARWEHTAGPYLWANGGKRCFWRTWPSPSWKTPSICFLHSHGHLLDVTPELLINEAPSSPRYLCRGLHTASFKPEGLGYNSLCDRKEYLFIQQLSLQGNTSNTFVVNDHAIWHRQIDMWSSQASEQLILNVLQITGPQAEEGMTLPYTKKWICAPDCKRNVPMGLGGGCITYNVCWTNNTTAQDRRATRRKGVTQRMTTFSPV